MTTDKKDTLCLAVASTYELVISKAITAHPFRAPYPRNVPSFIVPIRKGGTLEQLFSVCQVVDVHPQEVERLKPALSYQEYKRLVEYIEQRKDTFGFGDEVYRFYILEPYCWIPGNQQRKGIQVSVWTESSELLKR